MNHKSSVSAWLLCDCFLTLHFAHNVFLVLEVLAYLLDLTSSRWHIIHRIFVAKVLHYLLPVRYFEIYMLIDLDCTIRFVCAAVE